MQIRTLFYVILQKLIIRQVMAMYFDIFLLPSHNSHEIYNGFLVI